MTHVSRLSRGMRPAALPSEVLSFAADQELIDPLIARPEDPVLLLTPTWSNAPLLDLSLDEACRISRTPAGDLELDLRFEIDEIDVSESLTLPVQLGDYEQHRDGSVSRFGMRRLGPGTWLLQPSLNMPGKIHAFVVMCGVPEPPPWDA